MNLKIVGIPGSNANHSYNRMLLEYISKAYEHDMTVVDVRKIPLFNESAKETPAAIQAMSDVIDAADAVVIACPETDHSVPSSLKSIIEWLSYQLHPFTNKPVLLVGASTDAQGSSRAQVDLRDVMISPGVNARVFQKEDFFMSFAQNLFDENGDITDPGTIKFLDKCLRDFECFAIANDQEVKLEEAALAKAEKEAAK